MNIDIKTKIVDHPLEEIFDLPGSSTVVEYKEVVPMELLQPPEYDSKDVEIEGQLEQVYSTAMTQVTAISDEMDRVEGRHKARMGEVTATMLNVALSAIREKNVMKMAKDRNKAAVRTAGTPHTVNNNLVVQADRNEILRALAEGRKANG